ncbi:hypothetical protein BDR04DRAFT_1111305 [Suillus decipiens]|nr:hypothetical protein BDR04DRAFT_1111305 [Suillus decipiens]
MQRKRELRELLTVISASSAMLGISQRTRLELERLIFADDDNDNHHHRTAAFLTRTSAGLQGPSLAVPKYLSYESES